MDQTRLTFFLKFNKKKNYFFKLKFNNNFFFYLNNKNTYTNNYFYLNEVNKNKKFIKIEKIDKQILVYKHYFLTITFF